MNGTVKQFYRLVTIMAPFGELGYNEIIQCSCEYQGNFIEYFKSTDFLNGEFKPARTKNHCAKQACYDNVDSTISFLMIILANLI